MYLLSFILADAGSASSEEFKQSLGTVIDAIDKLIGIGTDLIYTIGFALAVLFVIIGFFRYLINDPEGGQTQVRNSLIGLVILGISKSIVVFVVERSHELQTAGSQGGSVGQITYDIIATKLIPQLEIWAGALAMLAMIWGGILYMSGQVKEGQAWIRNVLIGVAGIILAFTIVNYISASLGFGGTLTPQ